MTPNQNETPKQKQRNLFTKMEFSSIFEWFSHIYYPLDSCMAYYLHLPYISAIHVGKYTMTNDPMVIVY